ncbi:hypothetical protein Pcinc_013234 [Petrolisthes cinctipes]|uniref:Uncharacterized protein n=1 Tax=Petrolisthes cinctipes TaxID=88211 RepID=A0AAE1KSG8_PETCI|nr:hypothetical protein Pcinc_013234 [Petrolisthes cinctipes]
MNSWRFILHHGYMRYSSPISCASHPYTTPPAFIVKPVPIPNLPTPTHISPLPRPTQTPSPFRPTPPRSPSSTQPIPTPPLPPPCSPSPKHISPSPRPKPTPSPFHPTPPCSPSSTQPIANPIPTPPRPPPCSSPTTLAAPDSMHSQPHLPLTPQACAALAATTTPQVVGALVATATPQASAPLIETSTTSLPNTPPHLSRSATHTTPPLTPSYTSHAPPTPPGLSSPRITTHHLNTWSHTTCSDSHAPPLLSRPSPVRSRARLATNRTRHRRHVASRALAPPHTIVTHGQPRLTASLFCHHASRTLTQPHPLTPHAHAGLTTLHTHRLHYHPFPTHGIPHVILTNSRTCTPLPKLHTYPHLSSCSHIMGTRRNTAVANRHTSLPLQGN